MLAGLSCARRHRHTRRTHRHTPIAHTNACCRSFHRLQVIGMLPLRELALDSHAYRQQPSMPRPQYSHLDNEGVKGMVDSICSRMRSGEQGGRLPCLA